MYVCVPVCVFVRARACTIQDLHETHFSGCSTPVLNNQSVYLNVQ